MRELFDRLRDGGETQFEALIADRVEEDLQLDFKTKSSAESPNMGDDDKRYLGEALSGFSNSAGGLLIFGVNCRPGSDGVDCVQSLSPFVSPDKIASDIRSMLGSLLQPSNDGIEIASVPSKTKPGAGYVLVWIPRSERRPHQSRAKGHFKYFKRMGRDFHVMEHYDIEDQFSRISAPKLSMRLSRLSEVPYSVSEYAYNYSIEIVNDSDHVAKFPFISLRNMHGCGINQRYYVLPYKHVPILRGGSLSGGQNDVIHPGTHDIAGQISVFFQRNFIGVGHPIGAWRMMEESSEHDSPYFDYVLGCEGMRGETGRWSMDRSQFKPPR